MALNGNTLGDEIKTAVDSEPEFQQPPYNDPAETVDAYRARLFRAQGNAIVDHIVANGVISVSVVLGAPSACAAGGIVSTPPAVLATDSAGTIA